jgi:hypothetical protein
MYVVTWKETSRQDALRNALYIRVIMHICSALAMGRHFHVVSVGVVFG